MRLRKGSSREQGAEHASGGIRPEGPFAPIEAEITICNDRTLPVLIVPEGFGEEESGKPKENPGKDSPRRNKGVDGLRDLPDDIGDTVLFRSDVEAHRDRLYTVPSRFRQVMVAAGMELARIRRSFVFLTTALLGIMLIVMTQLDFMGVMINQYLAEFGFTYLRDGDGPYGKMASYLALMPVLAALYSATYTSVTIPSEYQERTIYGYLCLPVTRGAMYLGKFIASLSPTIFLLVVGYASSLFSASVSCGFLPDCIPVVSSLLVSACSAFSVSALVYCLSVNRRNGYITLNFLLILALVPLLSAVAGSLEGVSPFLDMVSDIIRTFAMHFPTVGFDLAVGMLSEPGITVSPMMLGDLVHYRPGDLWAEVAVSMFLGVACLMIGKRAFDRRSV